MKLSNILLLLGVAGFIAFGIASSGPAHAGLLDNLFKKKQTVVNLADIYPIQTEDEFDSVAKSFHGTPYNDPQIEFEILVPKDWAYEETTQVHNSNGPSRELMGDIARFKSPVISAMQAVVRVDSIKLDREISAENWLKNYMLANNYDIQGNITVTSDRKASANCIVAIEGRSNYSYVSVQINGSNAVIVRFESPMSLKDALGFVRKRIVDSFRFILETDRPIEEQKAFDFSDIVKFKYPGSLDLNHIDIKDTRHMSVQLYNMRKKGNVDPLIRNPVSQILGLTRIDVVKRVPGTSLKKETDEFKTFVNSVLALEFRKLVDSKKAIASSRFMFSRYEIYQVAAKKSNAIEQELRFVALGDKNYYVFALMLTPSESENFSAWATNTRDFDMIVRDFK